MRRVNTPILLTAFLLACLNGDTFVTGNCQPAQADPESMEQNRNPHAERYAELEKNIREHIKGEMKTIELLRLPKDYLETCNAKITNARLEDLLVVATHVDGAADKRIGIKIDIFENPEAAIRRLVGRYAASNAPKDIVDRALSAKYGDVCFAGTRRICFLRSNVIVTVWGKKPEAMNAVIEAAKAFDAAIKASADLPAAKDGAKFEYPKEMLTENATKPSSFFREGADEDPTASYIRTWSIAYFRQLKKFIDNYRKNWDKETNASRAAFCKLAGKTRAKDAIPVLVEHLDFRYFGESDIPRAISPFPGILEGRLALEALIEIGMPSLEPVFSKILELPDKEIKNNSFRTVYAKRVLKEITTKVLGKDLSVAYLKIKLNDKDLSEKARAAIESTLSEIRPPEEKADKTDTPAPSEPEEKPEE